jgi:hypothetical protein
MDKRSFDNLWKWFNYEDELKESTYQILKLTTKEVNNIETLERLVDFPSFLAMDYYLIDLTDENTNTKINWRTSISLYTRSNSILGQISENEDYNITIHKNIQEILVNLTYIVLGNYRKFVEDYHRIKL